MGSKSEAEMAGWIEPILWQDLATALNRLGEWGVDPLAALADRLGVGGVRELDPTGRGWMLRYQPPFCPDPARPGHDLPSGWHVAERNA